MQSEESENKTSLSSLIDKLDWREKESYGAKMFDEFSKNHITDTHKFGIWMQQVDPETSRKIMASAVKAVKEAKEAESKDKFSSIY